MQPADNHPVRVKTGRKTIHRVRIIERISIRRTILEGERSFD